MSLWWIMIIRYKIGYVHLDVNIYMRISMLHIQFINFPFAHRVTEFLISPRHRFHGWAFENLQHVIFQHVIFDLRVLIRITTFCGFDVNWHRVFRKLAPYDTAPFGELQSINNEYPWHENLKPEPQTLMQWRYHSCTERCPTLQQLPFLNNSIVRTDAIH